ncbi:MAG: extracellular solute-binding protein [Spirochaetales bacterium]|nr:extracellular solute-binding protein [Spirochaetales bacterium]
MVKRFLVIALVLMVAFSAFAAGSNESKGKTVVTIWHSAQGSNTEVFEKLAETFNSTIGQQKGIEIEPIYQGKANDVLTKVNAATGTDSLPDIAMMDATAATDMNKSPYLVTVDKLGLDASDILECAIASYTSENGLLAVPFNASALLYYYNKSLYDSLGLVPPKTLDDMANVVAKTASAERSGFAGVPATFELSTFIGAQHGLSYMLNNRNGHDGAATEVLFGKEGTYKAFLEKWKKVYDTGAYNPISSGVTAEFTSGRCAAMLASSSNLASVINASSGEFEVGVAKVPIVNEDATGGTVISGGALFSFTQSEAVRTVLEYLISADVQAIWSEGIGYVPVCKKAYETPSYKAFLENNPLYKVASDSLMDSSAGLANVWVPSAYSVYYSFQQNIVDVLNGKDIDDAVSEMVGIVENAIKTYAAQN